MNSKEALLQLITYMSDSYYDKTYPLYSIVLEDLDKLEDLKNYMKASIKNFNFIEKDETIMLAFDKSKLKEWLGNDK